MTARELTSSVRPANEADAWASASIDERIQRDVNKSRVQKTIVPYLAQHPDRFFGSFIVLAQPGKLVFESIGDVVGDKLPAAYRSQVGEVGFLTFTGGELIALDGQHRLLAFREVITGGPELGPHWSQVGDDQVCVLVLEEETPEKTRRIFNKVNRHAKPTGKSDNIITSEDDGYALVTRRLLDSSLGAPLAARQREGQSYELVNWLGTTLDQKTTRLTTISAVYETVQDILTLRGFKGFSEKDSPVAPDDKTLDRAYDVASEWWEALLTLSAFRDALKDPDSIPSTRFDSDDPRTLLLRPVGQMALVKGLVRAITFSKDDLTLKELLARVDRLDFSATPKSIWRDTIVRADGRMVAKKDAYDLAGRLICYMIASDYMTAEFTETLYEDWNRARGKDPFSAIDELEEHERPEDLPEPLTV